MDSGLNTDNELHAEINVLKKSTPILLVCFALFLPACSEKQGETATSLNRSKPGPSVHTEASGKAVTAEKAVSEAIKKQTLPGFPAMPIGQALDSYSHITAHEWKTVRTDSGKFYIDYIGWLDSKGMDISGLKNGVSRQGIDLKFVVSSDGAFGLVMVSRLEAKSDGMVYSYPLENSRQILEMIYNNKEIRF